MFVKPAVGVQVRYPPPNQRRVLPASGAEVPEESYWLRRLNAGDVVLAEQIPDSSATATGVEESTLEDSYRPGSDEVK